MENPNPPSHAKNFILKLIGGTLFATLMASLMIVTIKLLNINLSQFDWPEWVFLFGIFFWMTTFMIWLIGKAPVAVIVVVAIILITLSVVSAYLFFSHYLPLPQAGMIGDILLSTVRRVG